MEMQIKNTEMTPITWQKIVRNLNEDKWEIWVHYIYFKDKIILSEIGLQDLNVNILQSVMMLGETSMIYPQRSEDI